VTPAAGAFAVAMMMFPRTDAADPTVGAPLDTIAFPPCTTPRPAVMYTLPPVEDNPEAAPAERTIAPATAAADVFPDTMDTPLDEPDEAEPAMILIAPPAEVPLPDRIVK
jgi:hypothetical protein